MSAPADKCEDCGKSGHHDKCPDCGMVVCQLCAEREGESCCDKAATARVFFILSVERTASGEGVCVWWRADASGYTSSIGEAGRYTRNEAMRHSDPPHHLVIPCRAVEVPASARVKLARSALKGSRFDRKGVAS